MHMRLSGKIVISSAVCGAALLLCTLLVTDNNSWIFRGLLWLGTMAICGAATFVGCLLSFVSGGICKVLWFGFHRLFDENQWEDDSRREKFLGRYYIFFFLFTLLILAKFISDFAFAQFTVTQLFLSGALGVSHGALIMILMHRSNRLGSVKLLP